MAYLYFTFKETLLELPNFGDVGTTVTKKRQSAEQLSFDLGLCLIDLTNLVIHSQRVLGHPAFT